MTARDRTLPPAPFRGISESNRPKGPVQWVLGRPDLARMLAEVAGAERAVLDLETTGLNERQRQGEDVAGARVVMASLTLPQIHPGTGRWDGVEPTTWIVPLSHPLSPFTGTWRATFTEVVAALAHHVVPVENHNVKFDARWVRAMTGIDASPLIVWDTQIASHLLNELRSNRLKDVVPALFRIDPWDSADLNVREAERADLWALGDYACRDTYWTWRFGEYQRELMYLDREDGAEPETPEDVEHHRLGRLATWVAMPTVRSLTRIETTGFRLDTAWATAELERARKEAAAALAELCERYGMDPRHASTAANANWFIALTQEAVARGELEVGALTPSGKPQWNKEVLRRQAKAGSRTAELILTERGEAKSAQYLSSWLEHAQADGRVHCSYNVGSVVTGRLSSSNPNMQQVTKSLRPAYIPAEGYYIADLDFSQIELRVAAFQAREEAMIAAFKRGDDLHRLFAARITGKAPGAVEPPERQKAKAGNFGLLFGMGAYGFKFYAESQYGVSMTDKEAAQIHRAFFEMWPGLRAWHNRVMSRVRRDGQISSPLGRVRRLPDALGDNDNLAAFADRAAINSPVQGMASDLMQMAAAWIQGLLPTSDEAVPGVRLVATVHDSIVAEVPIDSWREATAEMKRRMENLDEVLARMGVVFDVPLVADATVGTRWGLDDISNPPTTEEAA